MTNTENFNDFGICRDAGVCGGCTHQGVEYCEQLAMKEAEVRQLFEEGEITPDRFDSIEGCALEHRFRYRNKMEYTFGDLVKDGPMTLGMHKVKNFLSIVTVDECQIVDEDFNRILRGTLDFCTERGYSQFHKRKHVGLMRYLIVRKGIRTGELLVNIVTSGEDGFDEEGYLAAIKALSLDNELVGVLRTVNLGVADKVSCDELHVLFGRDYYMEEIMGLRFKVSAFSFFQTNVEAVERLYSEAIALIDDFSSKTVYDLYCGTGTISQVLALKASKVIGVELVADAVESAKVNASINGLGNCDFRCGDVFEVLDSINDVDMPDVIVVDPPRAGMSEKAVDKIASYGVNEIVYISCNPKSLVKNLRQFETLGYKTSYAKAFDNFPMTSHTECIVSLSKSHE